MQTKFQKNLLYIVLVSLNSIFATAQVKPFRLGYTNVDYLISLHPDSKKVDSELKSYRTQLDKEADNLVSEFRSKYESYEKGKTMMAEPVRATKEKELTELQERIQEFQRNAEADLQKKQMELLQPVLDKIQKAIDAIAEENGFTYILNSDAGYGTTPVLLHGPPSDNVTDLILKKLGITPPPKMLSITQPEAKAWYLPPKNQTPLWGNNLYQLHPKMILPPFLKQGDKVIIIATARKISESELKPAVDIISSWGLEVHLGKNIYKIHHQFAGTTAERIYDLQTALDSDEYKAILCARGGYGTAPLLDYIDFVQFVKKPKWIVGFSDITALLNHVSNFGIASIHATMPVLFSKHGHVHAINSLKNTLFGYCTPLEFSTHELNRQGSCTGQLAGGNLSVLHTLIGTSSEPNYHGKILLLEDIDEYLYHIHRIINHFYRLKIFEKISGLLIGKFTNMRDNIVPFGQTAFEIIYEAVKDYNFPTCFNISSGHDANNLALIIGKNYKLTVQNNKVVLQ